MIAVTISRVAPSDGEPRVVGVRPVAHGQELDAVHRVLQPGDLDKANINTKTTSLFIN